MPKVVVVKDVVANAEASTNVSKVTAPVDFDHSIGADYNARRGTVTGGHSTVNGDVKVIAVVEAADANGVYQARVQMQDPGGNWIDKTGNKGVNTMYPSAWTKDRIMIEIDGAWNGRGSVPGNPDMWQGVTPSGVLVRGFLTPRITAYPVYGGTP